MKGILLGRQAVLATATRLFAIGGTIIASALLIATLSPLELGRYFSLLTYGYVLNAAFGVGLDQVLQKQYLQLARSAAFPFRHYRQIVAAFLFMTLSCAALLSYWTGLASIPLIALLAFTTFVTSNLRSLNLMLGNQHALNLMVLIEGALKPITLSVALLLLALPTHYAAIVSLIVTQLVIAQLALIAVLRTTRQVDDTATISAQAAAAVLMPVGAGALMNLAQLQGYRIYLSRASQTEVVGVYAAISNVGGVAMQALGAIYNQISLQYLYIGEKQGDAARYFRGAIFVVGACLLLTAVASPVFLFMFQPKYIALWYLGLFGVLVEGSNLVLGSAGVYLTVRHGRSRMISVFGLLALLVTAASFSAIDGQAQPWQIGASLSAGQVVAALAAIVYVRKLAAAPSQDAV